MIEWNTALDAQVVTLTGADGDETVLYKKGIFDELDALNAETLAGLDGSTRALYDAQSAETDRGFAAIRAAHAAAVAGMFKGRRAR